MFGQALEFGQPDLGQAPEAFDAVDMDGSLRELVAGMIDADVAIAEIDQAVVAAPAIGVDDGARVDPAADNTLEGGLGAVRDDLGVDAALALKDAENDRLAVGAAPPPALDAPRPEEALVNLDDCRTGGAGLRRPAACVPARPGRAGSRCCGSAHSAPLPAEPSDRRRRSARAHGSWPQKSLNALHTCFSLPCLALCLIQRDSARSLRRRRWGGVKWVVGPCCASLCRSDFGGRPTRELLGEGRSR